MPSKRPLIAVRVADDLYAAIRVAADRDGRTMGNFVDMHLRRYLMANGVPLTTAEKQAVHRKNMAARGERMAKRQVDIETAIAAAVKRGPVKAAKHK